jgi:hypothetical protein
MEPILLETVLNAIERHRRTSYPLALLRAGQVEQALERVQHSDSAHRFSEYLLLLWEAENTRPEICSQILDALNADQSLRCDSLYHSESLWLWLHLKPETREQIRWFDIHRILPGSASYMCFVLAVDETVAEGLLELFPNNLNVLDELASYWLRLNQPVRAQALYQRMLSVLQGADAVPQSSILLILRPVKNLLALGQIDDAEAILNLVEQRPETNRWSILALRALCAAQRGDEQTLEALLDILNEWQPVNNQQRLAEALPVFARLHQVERIQRELARIGELNADWLWLLFRALGRERDYETAQTLLESFSSDSLPRLWTAFCEGLIEGGHLEEAEQLVATHSVTEESQWLYHKLTEQWLQRGEPERALHWLSMMRDDYSRIQGLPDYILIAWHAGLSETVSTLAHQALELWQQIVRGITLEPWAEAGDWLEIGFRLASALVQIGRDTEARQVLAEAFLRARQLWSDEALAWRITLADIAAHAGRLQDALEIVQEIPSEKWQYLWESLIWHTIVQQSIDKNQREWGVAAIRLATDHWRVGYQQAPNRELFIRGCKLLRYALELDDRHHVEQIWQILMASVESGQLSASEMHLEGLIEATIQLERYDEAYALWQKTDTSVQRELLYRMWAAVLGETQIPALVRQRLRNLAEQRDLAFAVFELIQWAGVLPESIWLELAQELLPQIPNEKSKQQFIKMLGSFRTESPSVPVRRQLLTQMGHSPEWHPFKEQIAAALASLGDIESAIAISGGELDENAVNAFVQWLLLIEQKYREAAEWTQRITHNPTNRLFNQINIVHQAIAHGDIAFALPLAQRLLFDEAVLWDALSESQCQWLRPALVRAMDTPECLPPLYRFLAIAPYCEQPTVFAQIALLHAKRGEFEEALHWAIQVLFDKHHLLWKMAEILLRAEATDLAVQLLEHICQTPDGADAALRLLAKTFPEQVKSIVQRVCA